MSAVSLHLDDIRSLAAHALGQAFDVHFDVVPLNGFHRLLVQPAPENEILDRGDAGVDDADLAGNGHSVDRADHAVSDRAEALSTLADQLCSFRHVAPLNSASMCGTAQRTSQRSGSSADRVILASTALYSHASQQQQSADCRARSKISHTNSRGVNAGTPTENRANRAACSNPPRCPAGGSTLLSTA